MSETMTVERIVEAYWLMKKKYWVRTRVPYKSGNNWSDFDVVSYNPESKDLVISESKVKGSKNTLRVLCQQTGSEVEKKADDYIMFGENIGSVYGKGLLFDNPEKMIDKITVQLVGNILLPEKKKKNQLREKLKNKSIQSIQESTTRVPEVKVNISTTLEVFVEIVMLVSNDDQGRRYGHPILDVAREISRYMSPNLEGTGRDKETSILVEDILKANFEKLMPVQR